MKIGQVVRLQSPSVNDSTIDLIQSSDEGGVYIVSLAFMLWAAKESLAWIIQPQP